MVRVLPNRIRRTRCLGERPIAVAQQERDCPVSIVCDREVQFSVVIEICRYDCVRPISYQDPGWRPKRSIAIAQQDDHYVADRIRYREIQFPIAVKVGCYDRRETLPDSNL